MSAGSNGNGAGHGGPSRGYTRPPFEPGNKASRTHGAQDSEILAPLAAQLRESLHSSAPWTRAAAFAQTVQSWSYAEAACIRYREWFDQRGLLDPAGEPLPGLVSWDRAEARAASLRAELGLSPQALGKLLTRAAAVASATGDRQALDDLQAEGGRILAARLAELEAGSGDG